MKKIKYFISSVGSTLLMLPMLVFAVDSNDGGFALGAEGGGGKLQLFMEGILGFINSFLIPFIIAIGFLVFVWGMFQFFILGGANDEAKEKGKSLMIWATVGFVLIIVFWGVINLLTDATGLGDQQIINTPGILIPGSNDS